MKNRVITALVLAISLLFLLFVANQILYLVVIGLMILTTEELVRTLEITVSLPSRILIYLLPIVLFLNQLFQFLPSYNYYLFLPVLLLFNFVIDKKMNIHSMFKTLFTQVFVFTLATIFYTIYQRDVYIFIYIAIATFGCDTGAYFSGMLFGKTKLAPQLSPKKNSRGSSWGNDY